MTDCYNQLPSSSEFFSSLNRLAEPTIRVNSVNFIWQIIIGATQWQRFISAAVSP
jgi:hypothetical protein